MAPQFGKEVEGDLRVASERMDCPVAVEVFSGNTADPSTVASQVNRIRKRFGIDRVALVGDRGMLTTARIREDIEPAGLDWVSALKTQDIRKLLKEGADGAPAPLVPEALVPDAVAEVTGPDFPGERLMVCMNPRLRQERARKRADLLQATEEALARIARSVRSGQLKGRESIDRRVGRDINRRKVGKHIEVDVTDNAISWRRRAERIAAEARLDGVYVIRTSLDSASMGAVEAVEAYKSLAGVERAFRNAKSDLRIRPVYVYSPDHVRAHVFLCMLALHVEWHMRRRLAPLLFEDDDRAGARAQRNSPVEKARPSESARRKAATKRTADDLPAHSFRTLLDDLSGMALNQLRLPGHGESLLSVVTRPTPVRKRAFQLLGVNPDHNVPMRLTG
ncbi:MAG: IS1634 family transposase [Alphaproteobacteria bacterium]|nr:IS1634 family transposase [Alphaproteobacteria bacterium]